MTERHVEPLLARPHSQAVARAIAGMTPVFGQRFSSRLERAWFEFRASGLRLRRTWRDLRAGETFTGKYLDHARLSAWPTVIGSSHTPLWRLTRADDGAEWKLTAGKVQNLRISARRLHGLVIPAGSVFSFWRAVGRPIRAKGYVAGRELREGCMVASTGGGLCQLSNALYAAALDADMEIVERHAHSKVVPGSLAERGLDATVFWNYVDLRFRAPADCVLDVSLDATHLHVRLRAREQTSASALTLPDQPNPHTSGHAHDCIGCEKRDCVEYIAPVAQTGHTAWLLDEVWPEFDRWLGERARTGDRILMPMDGKRRGRAAYAWSVAQLPKAQIVEHAMHTVARGVATRLLGVQGAARQRGLLRLDRLLASAYARKLAPEADHLVISLNLLPHLWNAGVLGGRRYTVLVNRSPLKLLHTQLDRARALHPQSPTLGDFRADEALVAAEDAALRGAHTLVTPHAAVAAYCRARYGAVVEELHWSTPAIKDAKRSDAPALGAVLFPASALGRKGAYEVRAACRALGLPVRVLGQAGEGAGFWSGVDVSPADRSDPWAGVGCVVLPAFVEHRPRLLLQALARGLPVLCSVECGLSADTPGVGIIRAGDEAGLTAALARVVDSNAIAATP